MYSQTSKSRVDQRLPANDWDSVERKINKKTNN